MISRRPLLAVNGLPSRLGGDDLPMPHIVHLTSTNLPDDVRVFQKECRSAVKSGCRVTLVVCHDRDGVVDGVEIKAVPKPTGRVCRMTRTAWQMYRAACKARGDIVQLHHPESIPIGLLLKLRGYKVIYDTHEAYPQKILSMQWVPKGFRRIASALFSRFERLTSRAWDHIIVADRFSAAAFQGRPTTVLANYPLLQDVQPPKRESEGKRILLYAGGINRDRGLLVMLEIARLLRDRNVELHLLGWFPNPDEEKLACKYDNVRFFGRQPLSVVYEHMLGADAGLLLLQPVPAYSYAGENTNKLFEYMWCGLPVIASNFPNLRRIIEEHNCGLCIDETDATRAAHTIAKLLDDAALRQRMGENGRAAVLHKYNWREASKELLSIYSTLLGRPGMAEQHQSAAGDAAGPLARGHLNSGD